MLWHVAIPCPGLSLGITLFTMQYIECTLHNFTLFTMYTADITHFTSNFSQCTLLFHIFTTLSTGIDYWCMNWKLPFSLLCRDHLKTHTVEKSFDHQRFTVRLLPLPGLVLVLVLVVTSIWSCASN